MSDLIERLRTRAAIRRKATCRGAEDRLANVLDEAADELAALRTELNQQSNVLEEITARAETALVDNIRLRTKLEEAERKMAKARREGMEEALLAVQHLRNPYYRGTEAIKHTWEIGVIEATNTIRAKIGEQKC